MSNKEKVVFVLTQCMKAGRQCAYVYLDLNERHRRILHTPNVNDIIKKKLKPFEFLPEQSFIYKDIYNTAKLASEELQTQQRYGVHSADLLLKFLQLESILVRNLKHIGTRIKEEHPNTEETTPQKKTAQAADVNGDELMVSEHINGRKLARELDKLNVYSDELNGIKFNE